MSRKHLILTIAAALATAPVAFTQQFETASIHPAEPGKRASIEPTPGNLAMRNVSLWTSIRWANGVHDYQMAGGPAWIKIDTFDIVARPIQESSVDDLRKMLRALLGERFKLVVHRETKEMPVYVINVGKNGPKLKAAKAPNSERGIVPASGGVTIESASIQDLSEFLSGLPMFDRPVLDKTALTGKFDMTLSLVDIAKGTAGELKQAIASADISNYAFALDQLGLKLEPQRAPIEMLVIDRAEKPSAN